MIESFLFLLTGIIGLVTIILMITSYGSNPFYNAFLPLIVVIVSIRFLIHGGYELDLQTVFTPDSGPFSIFYLIIVPCFYLYNKNLVLQTKSYNYKNLKHLIAILLIYGINIALKDSFIFYFGAITNLFIIGIFVAFYLVLAFKLLSKELWFNKNRLEKSIFYRLAKKWTIYLFSINVLATLGLLSSIYTEANTSFSLSGKSFATPILVFWLFLYFKILTTPEILYGLPALSKKLLKFKTNTTENTPSTGLITNNWILETDSKRSLQDLKLHEKIKHSIASYTQKVDKLSTQDFIFRNPKISQIDIAKALAVPTSHIIFLFKYHSKISFSEYRTHSRIQDAISLLETGFLNTETLESLAYTTGFASYNPFFSAFKKITSSAPQDFLKTSKHSVET